MHQVRGKRFFRAKHGVGIFVKDSFPIGATDAGWRVLGKGFSVTVKLSLHHHVPAIRRVVPVNLFGAEIVRAHFCGGRRFCPCLTFVRLRVAICAEQCDNRKTCRQQSSFHLISSSRRVSNPIAADFTSAPRRILYFSLSFRHNGSRLAINRGCTHRPSMVKSP